MLVVLWWYYSMVAVVVVSSINEPYQKVQCLPNQSEVTSPLPPLSFDTSLTVGLKNIRLPEFSNSRRLELSDICFQGMSVWDHHWQGRYAAHRCWPLLLYQYNPMDRQIGKDETNLHIITIWWWTTPIVSSRTTTTLSTQKTSNDSSRNNAVLSWFEQPFLYHMGAAIKQSVHFLLNQETYGFTT